MNRADYMAALRRALSVLPEEERANALRYYEEYFDDAGPENEAKAIEELGEPAKVAAQILADYRELTAVPHTQPIKEKRRWRGISPLLLIVLAATIVSGGVLSRYMSRPIHRLNKAVGEFEANAEGFSYEPVYGSLEVTSLSNAFGHLVIRIQELMNQVRNEEIVLRKTELRALQAQINPHFLYNTLDSIAWMCEEGRTKDAVEMVNARARLFRISISKGHELIPVEKEVEHAKSYLQIQKFRYKNQFQYSFDVQESCLHYYCNKITLQPIIENAIYHGLNRMIDEGFIEIKIFEDGGDVVFTVEDNGVGMTKEQCESILHKEVKGQTGGIGIKNVNDRVKIYFGEQYGMKIESELDEGTKVSIRMPKLEEDSYEAR